MKSVQDKDQADQQLNREKVAYMTTRMKLNRKSFPELSSFERPTLEAKIAQNKVKSGLDGLSVTVYLAGCKELLFARSSVIFAPSKPDTCRLKVAPTS